MAGIKLVHVPYPGSAQAMTDVVPAASNCGSRRCRRCRSRSRRQAQGHRGDHGATRQHRARRADHGGSRPARLRPRPVVRPAGAGRHAAADRRQARARSPTTRSRSPDLIEPLRKIGIDTIGGTPEDFARYIDAEVKKATEVANAANSGNDSSGSCALNPRPGSTVICPARRDHRQQQIGLLVAAGMDRVGRRNCSRRDSACSRALPTPSRGWTSSRMRWPFLNTIEVGQISTSTCTISPGVR